MHLATAHKLCFSELVITHYLKAKVHIMSPHFLSKNLHLILQHKACWLQKCTYIIYMSERKKNLTRSLYTVYDCNI